jgi:cardiolipin synthase A/B
LIWNRPELSVAPVHLPPTLLPAGAASWAALRTPGPVFTGGNQAEVLRGGDELFPALIEAIDQARHEVWLATYIFYSDAAAQSVAEALAAAARRGVAVRVVVDGFGTHNTLGQVQAWLLPHGVSLVVFRPLERWWNWLQPGQLRRLHQKLCVVDGQIAFIGGINLIDDRLDMHHGLGEAPRLDFAVRLGGPVVAPVAQSLKAVWTRAAFGRYWRHEVGALVRSAEPLDQARKLWRQVRMAPRGTPATEPLAPVQAAFLVRDNLRQRRTIERSVIEAIRGAREQVDLVTPYFYPGRSFRRVLMRAARRGVRVRLLLQGKLDYRLAGLAARVLYEELLAVGIEIFEYTPAFLHAKMTIVDRHWATVGSSNIDPLSLLLNLEANVVLRDPGLAGQLTAEFELAVAASAQITTPPLAQGAWAVLQRGFVAWMAHWYLRMAGLNGRY